MYENKKDYDRFCIDEVLDKVRRKKKKKDRKNSEKQIIKNNLQNY